MKRVVKISFPKESCIDGPLSLGKAIRAARTGQGMSIEEAAMLLGLAKQTLCNIEAGKLTVAFGIVMHVANELGVSLFMAPATERDRIRHLIHSTST
jgi:transcriptional regulator with XRE-family HTH domain